MNPFQFQKNPNPFNLPYHPINQLQPVGGDNRIALEMDYVSRMQIQSAVKRRNNRFKNLALAPYNTPPEGNAPFNYSGLLDGAGTQSTSPVLFTFLVPQGWDGLIKYYITAYNNGTNYVNGSQSLIWAVRVNKNYVKGYQDIRYQTSLSADDGKISPGIIIKSGQVVDMIVTVDPTFVPDGQSSLLGGLAGFFYPTGAVRTN